MADEQQPPDPNAGLAGKYPRAVSYAEALIDALMGVVGVGPDTKGNQLGQIVGAAMPIAGPLKAAKAARAVKPLAALDMSEAARMKRAADQGFDTSRQMYHGTSSDFPEFKQQRRELYLTDKPEIADIYADATGRHTGMGANAGPNVMPLYAKAKKPLVVSDLGPDGSNGWNSDNLAAALGVENPGTGRGLYDEARRQGYDLIEVRDMSDLGPKRQTQFIPLHPSGVRSKFAAFDPSKMDSGNLLAALTAMLGGGMAASQIGEKK